MLNALLLSQRLLAHADAEGAVWVTTLFSHQLRWRAPQAHQGVVTVLAFSPDGRLLASGGQDGLVQVWDTATGTLSQTFRHGSPVELLHWSPTHLLASASQDHLQVWVLAPTAPWNAAGTLPV